MAAAQNIYACACLNVRVNVQDTAEERTTLEDIENVLECTLDSSAIHIELSALVEVVPGSSIDRKISAVRCLLCKSHAAYFESPSPASQPAAMSHPSSGQRQMPAPFTTVYLPKSTKDPEQVLASMGKPEYSQPFGVLLQPDYIDVAQPRHSGHIPRAMQQKSAEFMHKQETDKNERVRDFIRAQDEELERIHRRTTNECNILAEIISKTHPQSPVTTQPTQQGRVGGSSGLAAMLRGGSAGSSSGGGGPSSRGLAGSLGGSIPFATIPARGATSRPRIGSSGSGDLFDHDLDDSGSRSNSNNNIPTTQDGGIGNQIGSSHKTPLIRLSDEYSDDMENEEHEFGDFNDDDGGRAPGGDHAVRDSLSLAVPSTHHQQGLPSGNSNLGQMLAGSMPIQIPRFGSSSMAAGGYSMNRQEYQQRVDEMDKSRRREQILRGLPKTFVPPHELMNQLHDSDADLLLVGSKPRDSYGIGRRHAPG